MVHLLKIKPEYYQAVDNGTKTFEIRKNDREYRVGDYIVLREWDGEAFTGQMVCGKITYLFSDKEFVAEGHVVLAFKIVHPIIIYKELRQNPELYKDKLAVYEYIIDNFLVPQL